MTKTTAIAVLEPEIREVGAHLKSLGSELRSGQMDIKLAAELANIYGKQLKAHTLILGERMFLKGITGTTPLLPSE